jgi:hypothetical protein
MRAHSVSYTTFLFGSTSGAAAGIAGTSPFTGTGRASEVAVRVACAGLAVTGLGADGPAVDTGAWATWGAAGAATCGVGCDASGSLAGSVGNLPTGEGMMVVDTRPVPRESASVPEGDGKTPASRCADGVRTAGSASGDTVTDSIGAPGICVEVRIADRATGSFAAKGAMLPAAAAAVGKGLETPS